MLRTAHHRLLLRRVAWLHQLARCFILGLVSVMVERWLHRDWRDHHHGPGALRMLCFVWCQQSMFLSCGLTNKLELFYLWKFDLASGLLELISSAQVRPGRVNRGYALLMTFELVGMWWHQRSRVIVERVQLFLRPKPGVRVLCDYR